MSKKLSDETKRKISETMRGKKRSEETKRRISKTLKKHPVRYWLGKKLSEERKRKLSEFHKGKKLSIETRRKMSEANKGKKLSEETKRKLSEALKGKMKGAKHYNWKGGITCKPYPSDWTDDLKEAIRKRDNYVCQLCGIHQDELKEWNKKLDIHHVDYDKDNLDPDNLISLCRKCHVKTNYNRDYWINYFQLKNYE